MPRVYHPAHPSILDPPSRYPSSEDKSQITPLDDRRPYRPRRLPLHRFMLEAYSRNRDIMTYILYVLILDLDMHVHAHAQVLQIPSC